jgi:hypothetical protein
MGGIGGGSIFAWLAYWPTGLRGAPWPTAAGTLACARRSPSSHRLPDCQLTSHTFGPRRREAGERQGHATHSSSSLGLSRVFGTPPMLPSMLPSIHDSTLLLYCTVCTVLHTTVRRTTVSMLCDCDAFPPSAFLLPPSSFLQASSARLPPSSARLRNYELRTTNYELPPLPFLVT